MSYILSLFFQQSDSEAVSAKGTSVALLNHDQLGPSITILAAVQLEWMRPEGKNFHTCYVHVNTLSQALFIQTWQLCYLCTCVCIFVRMHLATSILVYYLPAVRWWPNESEPCMQGHTKYIITLLIRGTCIHSSLLCVCGVFVSVGIMVIGNCNWL